VEFRVLGPLEVVCDEKSIAISPGRQETVLALLLLEANHIVSVARLIDALWADNPPRTAKSQVHITVSALRQTLGEKVIETRSPGYLIQPGNGALDLECFEILVTSAGQAAAEQRLPDAVEQLRSALALWRGNAVEGIESEIIRAIAMGLNERRISVMQDCIDLELQLGRNNDIIGELTELVTEHPLNERFRSQLMLAFYRTGRQADALEAFRAGREILQEELGLDPGEELCRLERLILTHDSEIGLAEGEHLARLAVKAGSPPAPRQLPRTITDLAGREEILRQMSQILTPEPSADDPLEVPVVVLTGRGGAGKTALAVRAAHMISTHFPDGQLFLQFRADTHQGTSGLLKYMLLSFGIQPDALPADLEGRAAMYRSWLATRRVLIVIDGAVSSSQVIPFLPGTCGCAAIITSTQRFASLEGAHQIEIGPLDDQSAYSLLENIIGAKRLRAEKAAARDLAHLCEGLPLALRIVAAKLSVRQHWRIGDMVKQLLDEERRLDELDLDGAGVRATLALSYDGLGEEARSLLRRLSLFRAEDFAYWVCAPLLDRDIRNAEDLLNELTQSHLVEITVAEDNSVRFHLHDLVRIFAAERLVSEESAIERSDSMYRLLGCRLSIAKMAHRQIYGGDFGVLRGTAQHWSFPQDTMEAIIQNPADWFRKERLGLITSILKAGQLGLDELCWELAVTSATLFESGFCNDDWRESHARALEVVRRMRNRRGEAALLYSLGTLELGIRIVTAREYFERSLQIFEEIGDDQGCALALVGTAYIDRLEGNYDKARKNYKEALARFKDAGDLAGEAHTIKTLAQIHKDWLDFDIAERMLANSLAICRKLNAPRLTAQTEYELAELYSTRGLPEAAVKSFEAALRLTRETGDVIGQAYALAGLGSAWRRLGDFAAAERELVLALAVTDNTEDRLIRVRVLLAVAELDYVSDRSNVALARIDEALSLLQELGSAEVLQAHALELLGRLHERAGRASVAEHAWRSAAELVDGSDAALADELTRELARLRKPN
jgi:DNA-binding SARP family transcriptional activator/tetratricopeptide (TPR) repeat protein